MVAELQQKRAVAEAIVVAPLEGLTQACACAETKQAEALVVADEQVEGGTGLRRVGGQNVRFSACLLVHQDSGNLTDIDLVFIQRRR